MGKTLPSTKIVHIPFPQGCNKNTWNGVQCLHLSARSFGNFSTPSWVLQVNFWNMGTIKRLILKYQPRKGQGVLYYAFSCELFDDELIPLTAQHCFIRLFLWWFAFTFFLKIFDEKIKMHNINKALNIKTTAKLLYLSLRMDILC